MVKSNQITSMRQVMFLLAVVIIILNIVLFVFYGYRSDSILTSLLLAIASSVVTLFIAFLDPKFHRIIAIPLTIAFVLGLIMSIMQINTIWQFFNIIHIVTFIITLFIYVLTGVGQIYIFAKPKMYHISDLVIFGLIASNAFINLGRSIFTFASFSIITGGNFYSLSHLILNGFLSPALSLILLLLYILDAKRLSEIEKTGELFHDDPDKAKSMKALSKLYQDGHLTWNEYEAKKELLKNQ